MHWLLERLAAYGDRPALVAGDRALSYAELMALVDERRGDLSREGIGAGDVVAFEGEHGPDACAMLLALLEARAIAVPIAAAGAERSARAVAVTGARGLFRLATGAYTPAEPAAPHPLVEALRARGHAGLVIFSSGSTGASKAALLDLEALIAKFEVPRRGQRTLAFLLVDHIGGINTLLAVLANGGTLVTLASRDPEEVASAIARHRVEVLPTSPTFLRMLLVSGAVLRHDLSSLRLVTYGTEPMPEITLRAVCEAFPGAELKQTYGLTELGIFRTKSKERGSLWVKVAGEGLSWRVVDGTLRIKTPSATLGYLDAPSPFDADGWYDTGDEVDVDGDYMLIRGRRSEIINVGGHKVHPAEVEGVLLEVGNVREAVAYARPSPVTGQVVAATLLLVEPEEEARVIERARAHCRARLARHQVPAVIAITEAPQHDARFKKRRRAEEV